MAGASAVIERPVNEENEAKTAPNAVNSKGGAIVPAKAKQGNPAGECPACKGGKQAYKATPRSPELKKSINCRLNRAIGQLNGVKKMVDEDRYCGDVLTQLAAAESAVKAVSRMVMQDHLHTCVVEKIQEGDTEVVDEVMDLLKKFGA